MYNINICMYVSFILVESGRTGVDPPVPSLISGG